MRTTSVTVVVIISKVLFWKLLDISYVQSSFSTFSRHSDNGIWKTPCRWRFYGNGSTYVLILSWVNIMKRKWAKEPGKLSDVRKSEPVLWRTFHLLLYSCFFSQTNLVFKYVDRIISVFVYLFFTYLPTFSLIFAWCERNTVGDSRLIVASTKLM